MAYELGILLGERDNPFWQEQELWYHRYLPDSPFEGQIFSPSHSGNTEEQAELCARLLREDYDALIVSALDENTLARAASGIRTRTVLVDAGPKLNPALTRTISRYLPVKVCDYQEQGRMCTQALLQRTPRLRRFCCIGGPQRARQSTGRVTGALAALSGLSRVEKRTVWSDFTREGGKAAMEQIMDWKPDAVFCANDLMALGALDALEARGAKIPVGGVDLIPSAVYSVRRDGLTATVGVNGGEIVTGLLGAVDEYLSAGLETQGFLAQNHVVTRESPWRSSTPRAHRRSAF